MFFILLNLRLAKKAEFGLEKQEAYLFADVTMKSTKDYIPKKSRTSKN